MDFLPKSSNSTATARTASGQRTIIENLYSPLDKNVSKGKEVGSVWKNMHLYGSSVF